jgi:putative OPT family oligopeptide transporter
MTSGKSSTANELTARSLILGLLLAMVMGAANVYVGLKAGMTVSASIPAAVVAMLLFRLLFRGGAALQANQVQTAASAGESLAAGIIFTMPALVMVGHWQRFDYWTVTLVAFAGGVLGIIFMVPMRRVFIEQSPELPYPEGVACAAVLQTGEQKQPGDSDRSQAGALVAGAAVGALFKLASGFFGLILSALEGAARVGGRVLYLGTDVSPMLVAVGFIVRLNVALLIFSGGALAWLLAIPLAGAYGDPGLSPLEQASALWADRIRYLGVGAMAVGGVHSIFQIRKGVMQALKTVARRPDAGESVDDTRRDISPLALLGVGAPAIAIVAYLYLRFTGETGMALLATVVMLVMGFFFTAVASYIVGLVGNSNSPVSGMTISAVLFTGLALFVCGYSGPSAVAATLGVAAVVCCIACTSGDVCNDLKTGQLVGATPYRQQIMQILGVLVACPIMAPVLQLLQDTSPGGIGGSELPAPQAGLFASLARALAGDGRLPWDMVGLGAAAGVLVVLIDAALKNRQARFRAHLMPIAVGVYLPLRLSVPILAGALLAAWIARRSGKEAAARKAPDRGILFSSGVIAGESLAGIGAAALAAAGITGIDLGLHPTLSTTLTVAAAALVLWLFLRFSREACRPS